jgi:hypothetical protein
VSLKSEFAEPITRRQGSLAGLPTLLTFVLLSASALDEDERDGGGEDH